MKRVHDTEIPEQNHRDRGFAIGFLTGTAVGMGLVLWLAPRVASELHQRMSESAKDLGKRASERYRQAGSRAGAAVDDLTRKGRAVRDDVAEAVAHGAHEVERYAIAAKSNRLRDASASGR